MKFVSRIFTVLLVLLLAVSAVTAAYATDIDLGVVINKELESEGTITVTVDNSEGTNAVLENSPAKLEIPCSYDYAKVFYGEQVVEGSILDTVNDKITFPVAKGGLYTIRKQAAHTVTFNVNGGSAVTSQTVTEGGKVKEPTDPTLDNCTFAGWYKDEALTTEWNFGTDTVSGTTTLYAKWTAAVTFHSNGGSAVASQTVTKGSKLTQPANPTRENYIFDGWYKNASCSNPWNFDNDTVTGTTTLYAKWAEAVTVTFNSNGGSAVESQHIKKGAKLTEPTAPTLANCTFAGWYTDETLSTAWNFETGTVNANTTLYAKWEATVTFNSNSGSAVDAQTVAKGGTLTKPTDPTLDNCTFAGWYKDAAFTTAWNFETDTVSENTTLYAKWTAAVTFNSNEGSAVASQTVTKGSKLTQPANPTKENHVFVGWYKDEACTTAWVFETDTVSANTTLYAKWATTTVVVDTSNAGTWEPTVDNDSLQTIVNNQTEADKSVSVKLSISKIDTTNTTDDVNAEVEAIEALALDRQLEYLDISLLRSIDDGAYQDIGAENNTLVKIALKFNFTGKTNIVLFRYHNDRVDVLREGTGTTTEHLEFDKNAGTLTIYAKKFSTYAIGYLESTDKLHAYSFKSSSYSWSKNSNRTLTIKIENEGQKDLLESIVINDSVVGSQYYDVELATDGSTINIKLKPGYLQNLPIKNGYKIIANFRNGGVAETKLNILKSSGNASTGDMFRMGLWATLLIGSAAGVAALLIFRKRKK